MLTSKWNYIVVGVNLTFALLCAIIHDPRAFLFLGLAMLTNWVGDKMRLMEEKEKGERNG